MPKGTSHWKDFMLLGPATLLHFFFRAATGPQTITMKHQQVNVDYWAMGKAMLTYGALTAMVWLMLRLFGAVFSLPRRLRAQQQTMQDTLAELQRRYPDLNITEDDLKNAEKELEDIIKEDDNKKEKEKQEKITDAEDKTTQEKIEDKKTI